MNRTYDEKEYNVDNYVIHYNRQEHLENEFTELYSKRYREYIWRQLAQLADRIADEDEWFYRYNQAMGMGIDKSTGTSDTKVDKHSDMYFDPEEMLMFDSEQLN